MNYQFGTPLLPGDTIGVVAPSAALAKDDIAQGIAVLQKMGYVVRPGKSVGAHWGYLAGTDEVRAGDINDAFADDRIDGIVCLRGGYGATRILPLLDYECIAAHPKVFVGFSDITALHTAFLQRSHMAAIHGPMVMSLGGKASDYTREQFAQGLRRPWAGGPVLLPPGYQLETIVPGTVSGPLYGGNLTLLAALTGTPYALRLDGGVLLLEEIGEDAYALDRMLCQLEQSGLIQRSRAVVFGEFTHCEPETEAPYEFTVRDVIWQYAKRWGKPAVWGVPAGHGRHNAWLPLGRTVQVCAQPSQASVCFAPFPE